MICGNRTAPSGGFDWPLTESRRIDITRIPFAAQVRIARRASTQMFTVVASMVLRAFHPR